MSIFRRAHTEQLYRDLRRANTESAKKERFLHFLSNLFQGDEIAQQRISDLTLGAERTIANIVRGNRDSFGKADTQAETIIIEWEKDLARTGEHARTQLAEYLQGNWASGERYRFTLIATDGIRWRQYAPDWSLLAGDKFSLGDRYQLKEIRRFDLEPETFAEFPFFLDEILFGSQPKFATLERIQADFGESSSVFINSLSALKVCAAEIERNPELSTAFDEWKRFLGIAYGKFDDTPEMFLVHTYLSIFAKFIAYAVTTGSNNIETSRIRSILGGEAFHELNIERFVEDDFFHWVKSERPFEVLRPVFREIRAKLSEYDFSEIREDILKGVYQELIDLDTRHALGEYYTPDWLCEEIIERIQINTQSKILDPACGSGSFLRAAIDRLAELKGGSVDAGEIVEQVVGIDIHPLSVQISKTTVLLALADHIRAASRPVVLHVYLANSLMIPKESASLFGTVFNVSIDGRKHAIDIGDIAGPGQFDALVTTCNKLVQKYSESLSYDRFEKLLLGGVKNCPKQETIQSIYDLYISLKTAHDAGRNSIWAFILQNSYKPVFLRGQFDFVVGNPPWLTYSDIASSDYQYLIRELAQEYGVAPRNQANFPHLEIASVFLAHAANYFINQSGRVAFVMPRSVFSADHHHNIRAGQAEGIKLTEAWDLDLVQPLFNVPAGVMFCRKEEKGAKSRRIPRSGLMGRRYQGRLPRPQMHIKSAQPYLSWDKVIWHYIVLTSSRGSKRSALSNRTSKPLSGINAYERGFSQGATIVPRNFYFVETTDDVDLTNDDQVVHISTSPIAVREAKEPWKGYIESGRTESSLLFQTALAKNLIPFHVMKPLLVVLPVISENVDGKPRYKMADSEELFAQGNIYGSEWFGLCEKFWKANRTARNAERDIGIYDWLDYQRKLTQQEAGGRYFVLYTASGQNCTASVLDVKRLARPFIADHKTYWCEVKSLREGDFLAAFLNSNFANELIKDFQSRGLFGARDVHKLIVKVPFPKYRSKDPDHTKLADVGGQCREMVGDLIKHSNIRLSSPRDLGVMRRRVLDSISRQIDVIDGLVEDISAQRTKKHQEGVGKRVRARGKSKSSQLF